MSSQIGWVRTVEIERERIWNIYEWSDWVDGEG